MLWIVHWVLMNISEEEHVMPALRVEFRTLIWSCLIFQVNDVEFFSDA